MCILLLSGKVFYKYQLCQVGNGVIPVPYILADFLIICSINYSGGILKYPTIIMDPLFVAVPLVVVSCILKLYFRNINPRIMLCLLHELTTL